MNDQFNAPISPAPVSGGPQGAFQVWMNAVTKPNEQTYADMAASPNAKSTTAFLWVFVASLIQFFLTFLVQGAVMRQILEQSGRGNFPLRGVGFTLVFSICGAPIGALIVTLFFAIGTAIIQWVAGMFKGRGTFDQMAYTFAAIQAPFAVVSGVFALFSAIPYVGLCFRIVLSLLVLYILVLEIMATKGVQQFGWGEAAGSVLLPGLVVGGLCCCLATVAGMAGGAAFQQYFRQLNPNP